MSSPRPTIHTSYGGDSINVSRKSARQKIDTYNYLMGMGMISDPPWISGSRISDLGLTTVVGSPLPGILKRTKLGKTGDVRLDGACFCGARPR